MLRSFFRPAAGALRRYASTAAAATESAAPEAQVTTLANGFRVVTESSPHQTATVAVHIDAGSRFETADNNGTAHFLEHMAFKGTQTRSRDQLERMVENMGIRLDAYTSRESTVYSARCFSSDVKDAVGILGDILTKSSFDPDAVQHERGVILREMAEVNAKPDEVVMDYLHAVAYQGSPLSYTILGPEEKIKSITRDDLVKYVETFYTAPRMVLVGTGGVDHNALVEAAEAAFGGLSSTDKAPLVPACEFHGAEVRYRDDSQPFASFALAVEGVSWSDPDYYPLYVANSLIGSWHESFGGSKHLSSALARETAANNLAHSYMSFHTAYSDTGLWGLFASVPYDKIEDFCYELTQEWMRISQAATEAEVDRAKAMLRAATLFSGDSSQAVNDEIGRQVLTLGRRMTPSEIDARINAVDAGMVMNAMKKYVYDRCPAVAAYGPTEQFPDYNRLRSQMVWLRT